MTPLSELRSLLQVPVATVGVVVVSNAITASVATARGLIIARTPGRALAAGERVTLRDGVAYPAAVADRIFVL